MSKVTVADLPKTEELSSPHMAKTTGGATCEAATAIWSNLHDTANALGSMGFTAAAANLDEAGNNALYGNCP